MSAKRKPTKAVPSLKAASLPQHRIPWKQLFSLTTIGLLVTVIAALVAFLQFQQDRRTAESSDRANATVVAALGQQIELSKQIATSQASGPQIGPTATAAAESIARAEATRDVLEKVQRQAQATMTALAPPPPNVAHVGVEVWMDKNGDDKLDPSVDALYTASDFELLLQVEVDNGLNSYIQTMFDSDDGVIDGRSKLDIRGRFQSVHVGWYADKLIVAPNYKDLSGVCPGPPLFPEGCVHGALIYDGTAATLKLLVAPI